MVAVQLRSHSKSCLDDLGMEMENARFEGSPALLPIWRWNHRYSFYEFNNVDVKILQSHLRLFFYEWRTWEATVEWMKRWPRQCMMQYRHSCIAEGFNHFLLPMIVGPHLWLGISSQRIAPSLRPFPLNTPSQVYSFWKLAERFFP